MSMKNSDIIGNRTRALEHLSSYSITKYNIHGDYFKHNIYSDLPKNKITSYPRFLNYYCTTIGYLFNNFLAILQFVNSILIFCKQYGIP
jgi:hypothetical protein